VPARRILANVDWLRRCGAPWRAWAIILFITSSLLAQPAKPPQTSEAAEQEAPAAPADPEAEQKKLDEAKELFRKGNQLRAGGELEGALDHYLRSRRLVPSIPNTLNAALTLDLLGRYDEAFEMYTELLSRFGGELDDDDRKTIAPAVRTLRNRLGSVDVSTNVQGAVLLIDGRERGRLPLQSPVPVLPGKHVVRVLKDGYETFEGQVEVKLRETLLVDAKLQRLTRVGRLRVEHAELAGADLFVDGANVGKLPWEGFLAPGRHLYWVRKGDVGTAPKQAVIVEGQTVLIDVRPGSLGPDLRFVVEPASGSFFIDGVPLGEAGWQGRLPHGDYNVEARERGYITARQKVNITAETQGTITLKLEIDKNHPRWAVASSGKLFVGAFAGWAIATGLGSDAEADCDQGLCTEERLAMGPIGGLRGGWEFPVGATVEIGVGYLALQKRLSRAKTDTSNNPVVQYAIEDELLFTGPFVSLGAGYHGSSGAFGFGARLHVGALFAAVSDDLTAHGTAGGRTRAAEIDNAGEVVRTAALFLQPELRAGLQLDDVFLGIGVGALIFPITGPQLETGDVRVGDQDGCTNTVPTPIECAAGAEIVREERAFTQFFAFYPSLNASYAF
jgi:hypothetical protein